MKLLHFSLKTTAKGQVNGKNFKCTIQDSIKSFVVEVNTVSDISKEIERMKALCIERKWKLQPIIFYINTETPKFAVCFDDIYYQFETFVVALDICFKLFFVFNFEYPVQCFKVWSFIQKYFYKITTKTDKLSPDVINLISDFES